MKTPTPKLVGFCLGNDGSSMSAAEAACTPTTGLQKRALVEAYDRAEDALRRAEFIAAVRGVADGGRPSDSVDVHREIDEAELVVAFRGQHAFVLKDAERALPGESVHVDRAIARIERHALDHRPPPTSTLERPRFEDQIDIVIACCRQPMVLGGNLSLREAGAPVTQLAFECEKCFRRVSVVDAWTPPPSPEMLAAYDAEP